MYIYIYVYIYLFSYILIYYVYTFPNTFPDTFTNTFTHNGARWLKHCVRATPLRTMAHAGSSIASEPRRELYPYSQCHKCCATPLLISSVAGGDSFCKKVRKTLALDPQTCITIA